MSEHTELRVWWSGVSQCPHKETVSGLAKDCFLCLQDVIAQREQAAANLARRLALKEALHCSQPWSLPMPNQPFEALKFTK